MAYPQTSGYQWQPNDAPFQRKEAISPKGSYTYPSAREQVDPSFSQFNGMNKMSAPGAKFQQPKADSLQGVIDAYESMGRAPIVGTDPRAGVTYAGGTPQARFQPSSGDSWRDRLYAERAATSNRGYGGQGTEQGAVQTPRRIQPLEAIEIPDMPTYTAQAYTPPEEDDSVYSGARQEAMSVGRRDLRQGTREAISTAQSLDNPSARGNFIKQALSGYGRGLESVAAGASREARGVAAGKRREQLETYKTNYAAKSDAYLKNYQSQINRISMDFAQKQSVAMANYSAQMDPNVEMGGGTAGEGRNSSLYQRFYGAK